MRTVEGQQQFATNVSRERLVFPIELRRGSPFKIVPDELKEVLNQLDLNIKGASMENQAEEFQRLTEEYQSLCGSLYWEKNKLPSKTRVNFTGSAYGYYCKIHPGKFVVTNMEDPNNPEQKLTIILAKSAFEEPSQGKRTKPVQEEIRVIDKKEDRKITRREKRLEVSRAQKQETIPATEKVPMTRITIYPGVRLFVFEGDPKKRLDGQSDEQREETLNNLQPLVVTEKMKMIVPGKSPLDSYKHTEGTFFRGKIDGKEYWATIGDVKQFADIGRSREQQAFGKAA